ncbi:MarR family transcriptional regulator [Steroidobacter sp. S1-65]|uniref:MarR family transcriptional regulator n=1 Tax=Steroidobacter gossypii TaxID=2805490 RepID=A0ABS1WY33_9GAMM|nr:MarR family transcriptional regulator [Steroidobacter gossypii]MBM0105878.1 MarR family transcriptional regulator [Steroidobacter gossypii]
MRRRLTDDADTRLYLSRFLQAAAQSDLTVYGVPLLLYISAHPGGRVPYSEALAELGLNRGQMERAIAALIDAKLIVRADSHDDARRVDLQITRTGEGVIDNLNDRAERKKNMFDKRT